MTDDEDFVYDEASGEWISAADARAAATGAEAVEVRDSVGNLLADGDQVTLIKDLTVKGAGQTLKHGFLEHWAEQGVLLLNSVLTVQMGMAASHRDRGWERFTDAVIRLVNARPEPVVFILWGSYAQKKAAFVDSVDKGGRHLVLKAPHPSPLSAHAGFFGSKPFSKANAFLREHGQKPIDWTLPPLT